MRALAWVVHTVSRIDLHDLRRKAWRTMLGLMSHLHYESKKEILKEVRKTASDERVQMSWVYPEERRLFYHLSIGRCHHLRAVDNAIDLEGRKKCHHPRLHHYRHLDHHHLDGLLDLMSARSDRILHTHSYQFHTSTIVWMCLA